MLHNFFESWKLDCPEEENTTEQPKDEESELEHANVDPDLGPLVTPRQLNQASCPAEQIQEALVLHILENQGLFMCSVSLNIFLVLLAQFFFFFSVKSFVNTCFVRTSVMFTESYTSYRECFL